MSRSADLVAAYVQAKDANRPWLMAEAFAANARLRTDIRSAAMAMPTTCEGLEAMTEALIRRFSRQFENIYTFCLTTPPPDGDRDFQCDWLVGMSVKESGEVRVGYGRYDWRFSAGAPIVIEALTITIARMEILPSTYARAVFGWLSGLPHPWCLRIAAIADMPALPGLDQVSDFLRAR